MRLGGPLLLVALAALGSAGCTRKANTAPTVTPEQAMRNRARAERFVAALTQVAPKERAAYVLAHPDEAKIAFQTSDPRMRAQLQQAMSEP